MDEPPRRWIVRCMTTVAFQPLSTVLVATAMNHGVITCSRHAPLSDVARLMTERNVHCIVVVDDEDARYPWALISDLDLTAAASVRQLNGQTAGATAATPVVMVSPDESVERAAQLMTEHGVAHLVVADRHSLRPVGVISTLDIAREAVVA
jgi:CBS domain-containing protein